MMKKRWFKLNWWLTAHTTNVAVWRVRYNAGEKTIPLPWAEAHGLAEVFNGVLYIDYDYCEQLDNL